MEIFNGLKDYDCSNIRADNYNFSIILISDSKDGKTLGNRDGKWCK